MSKYLLSVFYSKFLFVHLMSSVQHKICVCELLASVNISLLGEIFELESTSHQGRVVKLSEKYDIEYLSPN